MMAAPIRVLYVDDDPSLLEIGRFFLEDSGNFKVTTALSASEGFSLLEPEKIDAIISDYQMPGLDGIQFLVEVRARFGLIPFILFTGRGREEVVIEAINRGVDFYLQKGGDPTAQFAELANKIRYAVTRRQSEEALRESEKRFRLLVQNSNDIIQIMDRQGIPFYISDQLLRILGYLPEERIGLSSLSDIHPDDLLAVQDSLSDLIRHPGTTGKIEYRYRHKKGNWIDLEAIGCSMLDDPAIHGIFLNIRDITDKKQAEKERAFKNLILSTQQETSPDAILIVDENGKILSYNQKFIGIWGVPDELIALGVDEPLLQFVVEQQADPDAFLSRVRYLYEQKYEKSFEELLLKDGRILERFSAPMLGETGYYFGRVWYFRDITDRKRAEKELLTKNQELNASYEHVAAVEEELRQQLDELTEKQAALRSSEEKFRAFTENISDLTTIADTNGVYTYVSPSILRLSGRNAEEFVGKKVSGLESTLGIVPEDIQMLRGCGRMALENPGITIPVPPYRGISPDGSTLYMEGSVTYLPDVPEIRGIIFHGRDITGRKRAEEALKNEQVFTHLLLDTSPAFFVAIGADGRTITMNQSLADALEYTPGEIKGADYLTTFVPEEDREILSTVFREIVIDGKATVNENRIISKSGKVYLVEWHGQFVKHEDKNLDFFVGVGIDITERKQAEKALRESEEQSRILLSSMPDIIMVHQDGIIVYANQTAVEKTGYSRDELIGSHLLDKVVAEYRDSILRNMAQRAAGEPVGDYEVDIIHKSGALRHVIVRTSPIVFNQVPSVVMILIDITGRKHAEEALRESENLYRTIFETTGAATIIIENDTTIMRANAGFAKLSGYSLDELEGKRSWTEFVAREDLEQMKRYHYDRRDNPAGETRVYEFTFVNRQGEIRHCINNVSVIPGTTRSVASVVDITGRKTAEMELETRHDELMAAYEQLAKAEEDLKIQYDTLAINEAEWESTFNAISDWITLITPDGQILRTNKKAESLPGIQSAQVLGKYCFELVHGTECQDEDCPRRRMLESKKREITEIPMRDGNGWLQVTVDPLVNSAGDVVSAVHIVRDITERIRSQKALEQAKKKLKLLNYVTFNDIQNLIFTLSGYHHFAKEKSTGNPVSLIIEKEDEILQKISHTLKFAQSYQDLGLKPPKWQNTNHIFLLAISHLDFLRINHTVLLDGLEIYADPLLEQVFQVLADNTLTHGKTATRVTLTYTRGPESITLFFEDDGVGIPEDIKIKIFSPDFQKKKGVGLFLASEILDITGITIRETGEPGKGARFEMAIPKGGFRFDSETN